jgi:DNA-binding GntR family transcriptional regulator
VSSSLTRSPIRCDFEQVQKQIAALIPGPLDPGRSYATQIHTLLRDQIVRGHLPPGTPLSEASIAAAMGISRTPVRESIRSLMQEQLVEVYPQVATRVAPLQVALIREGCFIRRALECANLLDVVKTISDAQRMEIHSLLLQMQDALNEETLDLLFQLDEKMHRRLFEFAGRSRVWTLIADTKLHLDRVRWLLIDNIEGHGERVLREHQEIVKLLLAADTENLCIKMQQHIEAVAVHLIDLRNCIPDSYFSD